MIASAPRPWARETATVMPRSLKLPVGLVPSNLSHARAPIRSERRGTSISGVEPSFRVTTGSPCSSERCSRYLSIRGAGIEFSHELFLDHPDRARRRPEEVKAGYLLHRPEEARLERLVHHHHQAGVVAHAA